LVLEQHIYQTNVDYVQTLLKAKESSDVKNYDPSEKGILTIYFKTTKAIAQVTPTGKLMLYVDSSEYDQAWKTMKPILATIDGRPLEIKQIDRILHPDNLRLRALTQFADENGSIESQLSVIDELKRMEAKRKRLDAERKK